MRHDVMKDADVLLKLDGPSFWDGLLNDRARKTLAKLGTKATRLDLASEEEALGFFAQANESLTLAAEASIRRMLQKNPNLVHVIRRDRGGPALGIFACLPLNEFGAASIANG